ncbi:MAG: DUF1840 family protein [Proteobacteria bacterium]|nr:DUF1840 family protein [Pseudomonadota bacterium]
MPKIVQFESRIGNLIMFKEHAIPLLKLMGLSGAIPSAILPNDILDALRRARAHPSLSQSFMNDDNNQNNEINIPLNTRSKPLFDLFERAEARKCEVIWW